MKILGHGLCNKIIYNIQLVGSSNYLGNIQILLQHK